MDEKIPIPAINTYHFSFEEGARPECTEWTTDTRRIAGMYGIALEMSHGGSLDIATNIFDSDTAQLLAAAAKKHQTDTAEMYGYTSPVLIIGPSGRTSYHSFGQTPGQQ